MNECILKLHVAKLFFLEKETLGLVRQQIQVFSSQLNCDIRKNPATASERAAELTGETVRTAHSNIANFWDHFSICDFAADICKVLIWSEETNLERKQKMTQLRF